jgi:hypothetical protein
VRKFATIAWSLFPRHRSQERIGIRSRISERLVHEITEFMARYTRREGRTFTLLGTAERATALELIRAAEQ